MERRLEQGIFASRWLMAPFYVGLIVALVMLLIKFLQYLFTKLPNVLSMDEADVILTVLSLIDLSLAGNLLIIVIFSGYENFVSKLEVGDHEDKPEWMGKVDFGGLKLKLVASIVAISAIHLLKAFMDIHKLSETEIFWLVVVHLSFVVSGVLLAAMDWMHERAKAVHRHSHATYPKGEDAPGG
jgi:uncharacterized protein (TIGR00645 family)